MILKTRKALPKFRLFRKFKVDFFTVYRKGGRVSRKYTKFNFSRRRRRYRFWRTRTLKSSAFKKFLMNRSKRLRRLHEKPLVERFSLLSITVRNKYRKFVNRLKKSVAATVSVRANVTLRNLANLNTATPGGLRFNELYNFKK